MARVRDRKLQAQIDRDKKAFREGGKATPLAKIYLGFDAMDAIWDLADDLDRRRKKK